MQRTDTTFVQVSSQLVEFLVADRKIKSLATKNMRNIRTWANALISGLLPENKLSLTAFLTQILENDPRLKGDASVATQLIAESGGEESFPNALVLGIGSQITQSLPPTLNTARVIAVCEKGSTCRGCVPEELLVKTVESMQSDSDVLNALYLFYSATNISSTNFDGEDDPYRTGARGMTRHFGSKKDLLKKKVQEVTTFQLHQFRSSGRGREPGWEHLQDFIFTERPMISALSEQIKCTLPSFPDVPYWRAWGENNP
jgi:hypothetical protein